MAFDLIAKDSSLINTSASNASKLDYAAKYGNKSNTSVKTNANADRTFLDAVVDYKAFEYSQVDWDNAISARSRKRQEFLDLWGQFYTSGSYADAKGNVRSGLSALEAADRYEFAEYLNTLYPEFSVDYFYKNAESFMKNATGVDANVKGYWDHIGKVWNMAWANFANGWEAFSNYVGYGLTGQFGSQAWENKKSEMAENRRVSAANYRKDLGDEVYDNLFQKMLSGTVEQTPQMAMMLAQMALTGGVGGISGFLASKEMIKSSTANTLAKVAKGLSTAVNFGISGIMDGGSAMADCTEFGFSDNTALWAGLTVGLFTGYVETWGDDQLLKPLNDAVDRVLKLGDGQVMHRAVKEFGERLKEGAWKKVKHVAASEITEPVQEEVEYVAELLIKSIANQYELAKGKGTSWENIGATKEQFWENTKETLVQTMLSTPLMTLVGLAASTGFEQVFGEGSAQWAPKRYMNKEGATNVTSTANFVLSGMKIDENIKDGENGKANPIKVVQIGDYIFPTESISKKQEDVIKNRGVAYTIDDGSKLTQKTKTELESSSIDPDVTLTSEKANEYLAVAYEKGMLEAYGFGQKESLMDKIGNKIHESDSPLLATSNEDTNVLYMELKGSESPVKINIGEEMSAQGSLNDLMDVTGVKMESLMSETAREYRTRKRAEEIQKKNEAKQAAKDKKAGKKTTTEKAEVNVSPTVSEDVVQAVKSTVNTEEGSGVRDLLAGSRISKKAPENAPFDITKVANSKTFNQFYKNDQFTSYEAFDENLNTTDDYLNAKYVRLTNAEGKSVVVSLPPSETSKKALLNNVATSPFKDEVKKNKVSSAKQKKSDTKKALEAVGVDTESAGSIETVSGEKKKNETAKKETAKQETKTEQAKSSVEPFNEGMLTDSDGKDWKTLEFSFEDDLTEEKKKHGKLLKTEREHEDLIHYYEDGTALIVEAITREQVDYIKRKMEAEKNTAPTEGEVVSKANEIAKENNISADEATETTVVGVGIQNAQDLITKDQTSFDDVVNTLTEEYVKKAVGRKKNLDTKLRAIAEAISKIDGIDNVYRQIFGADAVVNESTKEEFTKLFIDYMNNRDVEINESTKVFFDTLKQGVLASYLVDSSNLQGSEKTEHDKLKGEEAKEQTTAKETLKDLKEKEKEQVKENTQQTQENATKQEESASETKAEEKSSPSKQNLEETNKIINDNTVLKTAVSLALEAKRYYNYQEYLQKDEQKKANLHARYVIYNDWYTKLVDNHDINTAYEFLSSTEASKLLALQRSEYKVKAKTKDGSPTEKTKVFTVNSLFGEQRKEALLSDYIVTYYSAEAAKEVMTKQDLRALSISPYLMSKMGTALIDGLDSYFKDIIRNDFIAPITIQGNPDKGESYRDYVIRKLRSMQTPEADLAVMSNIATIISDIDMQDVKKRDEAIKNNTHLRENFVNIMSQILLEDFLKQYPEGEKYSRGTIESYIEKKWNNSAVGFTNLLADTSIYNVFKNQQQYIDNSTAKLIPEAEDKIRQQTEVDTETSNLDSEYMNAVESGDIETARKMVEERAKELGFDNAIPEQADSFAIRTKAAPKKTIKAYKTFFVDENGAPSALFVDGRQNIPMNVWVDAKEAFYFVDPVNGRKYVPSVVNPNAEKGTGKTGSSRYFSVTDQSELLKRGYITEKTKIKDGIGAITALAYRPGWHAGDLPFFPQGGTHIDGTNYENAHRWNQVVFEIEMDADYDYTETAKQEGIEKRKTDKKAKDDLQYMPEGGFYRFTTNPTVENQTDGKGAWFIGDSIKIVRALTEEECNKILAENGMKPQEWESMDSKGELGSLDLGRLGYNGPLFDAARKTLAPITYDDNGNVIPLSQRFNSQIDDIRYQQSTTPLNQTIQGRTEPALIKSSFRYDNNTGKYYISGDVYNEIVEVMRSSFPILNDTVETEVRKTATLATAFLTSLSKDTQDALVRKSATATGGKFLTGGNENLLRLFFNMNELKDTKGVSEYTKGLSLSQSAKIILGMNSDESTIRHEGTHIVWWADSNFRERAQTEFKKYFEQDSDGKEIRAVVEANLDRFGGYTADQVIDALKNLTREDYDYTKDEFLSTEEAIAYMGEMHWESKDKIEYSAGVRGLFERLAHILKDAFEKLKNFFNTDLLVETNNNIYAPLFENESKARKYYNKLKVQEAQDITLKERANTRSLGVSADGTTQVLERDGSMIISRGTGSVGLTDALAYDGKIAMPSIALTVPKKVPFYNAVHGGVVFLGNTEQAQRYMRKGWVYDRDLASGRYPTITRSLIEVFDNVVAARLMEQYVDKLPDDLFVDLDAAPYTIRQDDIDEYRSAGATSINLKDYLRKIVSSYKDNTYSKLFPISDNAAAPFETLYEDAIWAANNVTIYGISPALLSKFKNELSFMKSPKEKRIAMIVSGLSTFIEQYNVGTATIEKWLHSPEYKRVLRDLQYWVSDGLFGELLYNLAETREKRNDIERRINTDLRAFRKKGAYTYESRDFFEKTGKLATPENALEIMKDRDAFSVFGAKGSPSRMVAYTNASKIYSIEEAHKNEWKYKYTDVYDGIKGHEITSSKQWVKAENAWASAFDAFEMFPNSKRLKEALADWFREYSKIGKRDYNALREKIENNLWKDRILPLAVSDNVDFLMYSIRKAVQLSEQVPTEYGEVKPVEIVNIRDFKLAIAFEGTDQAQIKELREKYGLKVISIDELKAEGKFDPNEKDAVHKLIQTAVSSSVGASDRIAFQKMADVVEGAYENNQLRDDVQAKTQYESLVYLHAKNEAEKVIKDWRKSKGEYFVNEDSISSLRSELENSGVFNAVQGISPELKEQVLDDVTHRIAYESEDYTTYANMLGKLKDNLKDKNGNYKPADSKEVNDALFALYGYRQREIINENGTKTVETVPVGLLSKLFANDTKGSYVRAKEYLLKEIMQAENQTGVELDNDLRQFILDKDGWKPSKKKAFTSVKTGDNTKINFNIEKMGMNVEELDAFLSTLVSDKDGAYSPVMWRKTDTESTFGDGYTVNGPLVDILNYIHKDETQATYTKDPTGIADDVYITAAYNTLNQSLKKGDKLDVYILDSMSQDFLGAIERLDATLLKNVYGTELSADFYEELGKSIDKNLQNKIEDFKALQNNKDLFEEATSTDELVNVLDDLFDEMWKSTKTVVKTVDGGSGLTSLEIHNLKQQFESAKKTVEKLQEENKEIKESDKYKNSTKLAKERDAALKKADDAIRNYKNRKDRIIEEAANIITTASRFNPSDPELSKQGWTALKTVNDLIKGLRQEIRTLTKEKTQLDTSLKEVEARLTEELNIAKGLEKDFNKAGVLPMFNLQIKEMKRVARDNGTGEVSKKLTTLMEYLSKAIATGSERYLNLSEVLDFNPVYTSLVSPKYLEYRENGDKLKMFVRDHMCATTNIPNTVKVVKTLKQLTAGELVELSSLISEVASDSMKYYKEMTKDEKKYHSEWHNAIAKEIVRFAKEKGINPNELSEADSVSASSAKSVTASKVNALIKEFMLQSVKYRDRFPTLYAYIYGGVDHQGRVYEGLNGGMNEVDKRSRDKFDRIKKSLVDNFSNSIFFDGTLTEKNLSDNMRILETKYTTTLEEGEFTEEDIKNTGFQISEYDHLDRKKMTVLIDENNDSAMREVARWLGKKEIKLMKLQDKLESTTEKYESKERGMDAKRRMIYNAQIGIENTRALANISESEKTARIEKLEERISNVSDLLERDERIQRNRLEKIEGYKNRIQVAEQDFGERPNQNTAKYTTQELLAIYMYARQEGGIDRLVYSPKVYNGGVADPQSSLTNNLSIGNVIWVIKQVENNPEYAPLKKFADTLSSIASENFEQIRDVKYYLSDGDVWLDPIRNYFAFTVDEDNFYEYGADLDTGLIKKSGEMDEAEYNHLAKNAKANDSMTKDRGAASALNLKIMERMYSAIYRQEYYVSMGKPIHELKNLMNNLDFQGAMRTYYGRNEGNQQLVSLSKYINALGNSQKTVYASAIDETVRFLTSNTAAAAMAFRLTTVVQQIPTMLWCLKDKHIGFKGLVTAMWRAIHDKDTVYGYSAQMQERANSAVNSIRHSKNLGSFIAQTTKFKDLGLGLEKIINKTQNTGLWLLEKTDSYIANAMWYAYFEGVKQENIEKGLNNSLSIEEFNTLCANEATQRVMDISPVQSAKDNATMYSNKNPWLRSALLFTNQTTKMLNGIVGAFRDMDIDGATYLAKVLAISVMTFVLNGLITGKLVRKTQDDDDEEEKVRLFRNTLYSIWQGSIELIPLLDNIVGDSYGETNLYTDVTNLMKVIGKDEDKRTEHQLANAWSYLVTDIMSSAGLAGTEARSIYRAFREGNPMYAYNTKWGEFTDREDK